MSQVIVVGGGLAGLSAAHTVMERGGRVVLLDKNSFLGGNSTKATSGINGALTSTQIELKIPDSPAQFYEDTAKSARDLLDPGLVRVLTYNSASAVEWLQHKFKLDLSLVSRLGGHSQPRTHRGKERFPGMTITYALMEALEEMAEKEPDRVKIIKRARVTRLLKEQGEIVGVEYVQVSREGNDSAPMTENGPVVLATGGYAADFTEQSLIKKYRPEIYNLPTTNGDWSTGDGIKMTLGVGGNAVTLDKVQVHPTGLVDPKEPDAKVKFLAAEALRGCGGILLDAKGNRFCDELGHRDYVTGKMWDNQGPFRLILNSAAGKEIEWHCKHYSGRGLMKYYASGKALAKEMGIPENSLSTTMSAYNDVASGSKKDPFGKKYFANTPLRMDDSFWVAIVTPVLHFTMGGVQITPEAEVMGGEGKAQPIPGLFAAGEVAGGVHGANRLGGSSLLGCVVYGRVAGATASRYLLSSLVSSGETASRRLAGVAGHLGMTNLAISVSNPSPSTQVNLTMHFDGRVNQGPKGAGPQKDLAPGQSPPSATNEAKDQSTTVPQEKSKPAAAPRKITMEEVAKHNKEDDCWVVVNGDVLDVTKFLPDHPGGKKAILLFAGKDATEEFNMLHKPDVVAKYAPETVLGKLSQ